MSVELRFEASATDGAVDTEHIQRAARLLLEQVGRSGDELSIALVSDNEMRRLNRVYRSRDLPTDVLSFALDDGEGADGGDGGPLYAAGGMTVAGAGPVAAKTRGVLLGDVVISVDSAGRQAHRGGWSLEEELNRLLVHGLLHLLGFDHERGEDERVRMQAEENHLAAVLEASGFRCAAEKGE